MGWGEPPDSPIGGGGKGKGWEVGMKTQQQPQTEGETDPLHKIWERDVTP